MMEAKINKLYEEFDQIWTNIVYYRILNGGHGGYAEASGTPRLHEIVQELCKLGDAWALEHKNIFKSAN